MNGPSTSFERLLLPLGAGHDDERVLVAATVLASWFDSPIQVVCGPQDDEASYQLLAAGLGLAVERVLALDEPVVDGLVAHASASSPALIVTDPSPSGMAIAAASRQPVFLVAETPARRLPLGPFVAEMHGTDHDTDVLAVLAAMAGGLDQAARLVIPIEEAADEPAEDLQRRANDAEARLREMGCLVGTDIVNRSSESPAVTVARTRGATAMVVPQDAVGDNSLIDTALKQGVNVLVAPERQPDAGRPAPFDIDVSTPVDIAPATSALQVMPRAECMHLLGHHQVARIGYVEDGWPMVVPVNYTLHGGDIYMQSLGGAKLRAAERGAAVCLELDGYDEQLRTGWSVVARGHLEVIRDATGLREAWAADPQPWVAADERRWLRLVPFAVTGRRVEPGTS